jgi:hypothetical protein
MPDPIPIHQAITAWIMVAACVAILLYDSWAFSTGGKVLTLTQTFRGMADAYPILPFLLGVVVGHLLWACHN